MLVVVELDVDVVAWAEAMEEDTAEKLSDTEDADEEL